MLLTDLQVGIPHVPTHANPADAPTCGKAVRREPLRAERSNLVNALMIGSIDAQTDEAFAASS